jgi:hypothetical protein
MTAQLPKSGLQVLDPQWYQCYHLERNVSQPVRFGVVFDDDFAERSEYFLSESALIHVLYWASTNSTALTSLAATTASVVIVPVAPSEKQHLLDAGINEENIGERPDDIYTRIEREIISKIHRKGEQEFRVRQAHHAKIAEEWREKIMPGPQRPFNPLDVNRCQIRQLLGQFREDFWHYKEEEQLDERGTAQVNAFDAVPNTLFAIATNRQEEKKFFRPPTAVFAFPSISPYFKKLLEDRVQGAEPASRKALKEMLGMMLGEQNSASFVIEVTPRNKKGLALMSAVAPEMASYTRFFDDMGYLHGSFQVGPYLRAALKGKSFAQEHSFFAPGTFPANADSRATVRKINAFTKALSDAVDDRIGHAISDYPGGVLALSDLPIEWLSDRGVPLCFSHDVCRIPETVSTSMLSQFTRNCHFSFEIEPDILSKTLVVCGAPSGDPIHQIFNSLSRLWTDDDAPWRWQHCESLDQLYKVVTDFRPQLLIFDTHGRFRDNNSGSELQIGKEYLTGNDVINNLPDVPLVLLSTCWGAPLYGCPNTIAHAFFEKGTFAVTSSMLPINAVKGGVLYNRVLNNLAYASKTPVHENWSSFVSHCVRTSYFDDLKARILHRYSDKLLDAETYRHERGSWQTSSLIYRTRRQAYLDTPQVIARCFAADIATKARQILNTQQYVPEFMYYSTMGRADLVQFACWNTEKHLPRDKQPTFGDLKTEQERLLLAGSRAKHVG